MQKANTGFAHNMCWGLSATVEEIPLHTQLRLLLLATQLITCTLPDEAIFKQGGGALLFVIGAVLRLSQLRVIPKDVSRNTTPGQDLCFLSTLC